ncbi:helix-turn-helix domain-containing protein [Cohnella abietis]|uniref:HTH cro/C1-type domain-containing protein n=1 Tax=Cohnella abietis TaxID=2507935 RepID=A0A3T1D2W7_9BACL|nr:helix-turn-helix transcriptional regulator [Cohnella abietis]BBI32453.1 hypothetical protein KCTCHS21_18520 [Cohnella abietis]
MKYGSILQACRERMGWSQEELAHKLHCSQSDISKIEHDRKGLDLDTVIAWTEATAAKEVLVAFICGMDGITIMQQLFQNVVQIVTG